MPQNLSPSPIVSFHFFQNEIINEFASIFSKEIHNSKLKPRKIDYTESISKMVKSNNIIFDDESIILFQFIELKIIDEKLITKFLTPLNKDMLNIVELLKNNFDDIYILMNKWKMLLNKYSGIQKDVPIEFIKLLKNKIIKGKIKSDEIFPLEFQKNINFYLQDFLNLLNIKNKSYDLFVKFENNDKPYSKDFKYKIYMVENVEGINMEKASADLINQLPKTKIYESTVQQKNIDILLYDLFIYGRVNITE